MHRFKIGLSLFFGSNLSLLSKYTSIQLLPRIHLLCLLPFYSEHNIFPFGLGALVSSCLKGSSLFMEPTCDLSMGQCMFFVVFLTFYRT